MKSSLNKRLIIISLLALHFNKIDLCNFCRSILIFHNIYQLSNQNPKLEILQSTAPFNSRAPFDNTIMASTHLLPKQGYAIIFYYPNQPYPHPHYARIYLPSIQKSISLCNPFEKSPSNIITIVIFPWASSYTALSHMTYTYVAASYLMSDRTQGKQCNNTDPTSLISHE